MIAKTTLTLRAGIWPNLVLLAAVLPRLAHAQVATPLPETEAAPSALPTPAAPPATETAPAAPSEAVPAPAREPSGALKAKPQEAKPQEEEALEGKPTKGPAVKIGSQLRIGFRIQNQRHPQKLDGQSVDLMDGRLLARGSVQEKVNWTFNLFARLDPSASQPAPTVRVLDAIVQFDLVEAFHVWAGQHVVCADRSNFSGPSYMIPWNYPGVFPGIGFVGPRQGPQGRNVGATVWGSFGQGVFKYYAGVFDLAAPTQRPLFSGRLNLDLIGKEPGAYNSSTYFGSQDILAIGVGGQVKQRTERVDTMGETVARDDYALFNADLLAEFSPGGRNAGTITGEGAYDHFVGHDINPADDAFFVLGAYLIPATIGPGRLQPMVRYQGAYQGDNSASIIDVFLNYVLDGDALRVSLGYQRAKDYSDRIYNAIQLGLQMKQQ